MRLKTWIASHFALLSRLGLSLPSVSLTVVATNLFVPCSQIQESVCTLRFQWQFNTVAVAQIKPILKGNTQWLGYSPFSSVWHVFLRFFSLELSNNLFPFYKLFGYISQPHFSWFSCNWLVIKNLNKKLTDFLYIIWTVSQTTQCYVKYSTLKTKHVSINFVSMDGNNSLATVPTWFPCKVQMITFEVFSRTEKKQLCHTEVDKCYPE